MVRLSRCCSGTTSACASCICSTGQRWRSDRMRFGSPELQNCKHLSAQDSEIIETSVPTRSQSDNDPRWSEHDPRMTWDCLETVAYFAHPSSKHAFSCTRSVLSLKNTFRVRLPPKVKVELTKAKLLCETSIKKESWRSKTIWKLQDSARLYFTTLLLIALVYSSLASPTLLFPSLLYSGRLYSSLLCTAPLYSAIFFSTLLFLNFCN